MKVNELEKLIGISRANIRFYESEGFIKPNRSENGYRNYSDEDVAVLKKVIVYRKLGLSIAEIKEVFNGHLSLNEAVNQSIENLENNIASQNIAIAICEEIKDKNIDNDDFDTDYYLDKISNYEAEGEEFIDVASIDITPFKHRKRVKALVIICIILFFTGIAYSFFCNYAFITNDNENYKDLLPEINTADTIDTVKADSENSIIYVFYDEAGCINTYDFNGRFLWAISVPLIKDRDMCYFYLQDNRIIIDDRGTAFVYDSKNGEFISKGFSQDMGLFPERDRYDEYHKEDEAKAKELGIIFDYYNVSIKDGAGKQISIVSKPFYILLLNDSFGFIISFISGLALAVIAYISRLRYLMKIKVNESEIRIIVKTYRYIILVIAAIYLLLAVSMLVFEIFGLTSIAVSIFPCTASFILLLLINSAVKLKMNESEIKITGTALHYCVLSFVVVLVSAFACAIFFQ